MDGSNAVLTGTTPNSIFHFSTATIDDSKDHTASITFKLDTSVSPVGPMRQLQFGVGFGEYSSCSDPSNVQGQFVGAMIQGFAFSGSPLPGLITPVGIGRGQANVVLLDDVQVPSWGTFQDLHNVPLTLTVRYAPVSGMLFVKKDSDPEVAVARCLNCDASKLKKASLFLGQFAPNGVDIKVDSFQCNEGEFAVSYFLFAFFLTSHSTSFSTYQPTYTLTHTHVVTATDIDPLPAGDGNPLCDRFDSSPLDANKWSKYHSCAGRTLAALDPVIENGHLTVPDNEKAFCLTYKPSYLPTSGERSASLDVFIPANSTSVRVTFGIGRLGKILRAGINIIVSDSKSDMVAGSGVGLAYQFYSPSPGSIALQSPMESYFGMTFRMTLTITETTETLSITLSDFTDGRSSEVYNFGTCTNCYSDIDPIASIQVFGGVLSGSGFSSTLQTPVTVDNFGCGKPTFCAFVVLRSLLK